MKVGIVGSEGAKFTNATEFKARQQISRLLQQPGVTAVVSGGCHLGGIDIWAEEIGQQLGLEVIVFKPKNLQWSTGYAPRNLQIAETADETHCITVAELPKSYTGMTFPLCYHCAKAGPGFSDVPHVKSGGCWTMHKARKMGKVGGLHIIREGD